MHPKSLILGFRLLFPPARILHWPPPSRITLVCSSICLISSVVELDFLPHHVADLLEVLELLVDAGVTLPPARLQPLCVNLLFALKLRDGGQFFAGLSPGDYLGQFRLLLFHLSNPTGYLFPRVLALLILFFSQICFFSCILSSSSSLAFRFVLVDELLQL